MRHLLIALLLASAAVAQNAPRADTYPDDFKPQPCAPTAEAICGHIRPGQMHDWAATFRGYDLHQEWVDAHWNEMMEGIRPLCAKIANCFTVKDNDWVFCIDMMPEAFTQHCSRYPEGSLDRDQCTMFGATYFIAIGAKTKVYEETVKCLDQQPPATSERTLKVWFTQPSYPASFDGKLHIIAIDDETHIPVHARVTMDGGPPLRATEGPYPTTGYALKWKAGLKQVSTANGRRELVRPKITVTATGYKPVTLEMPVETSSIVTDMLPKQLKRGRNKFTVVAKDSVTGKPLRGRVMAGDTYLGETNQIVELEIKKGDKIPEIWVMSLYDKYGDAVVRPAAP